MNYKILTSRSVLDIADNEQYTKECELLVQEQDRIIAEKRPSDYYKCHFIKDSHFMNDRVNYVYDLQQAIQCLAIKEGYDLVQFENGNLGYVAYYNGHENMFEFESCTEQEYMEG